MKCIFCASLGTMCNVCRIREYQQVEREQGPEAVVDLAIRRGRGRGSNFRRVARGASAPCDRLHGAAEGEAVERMRG